MSWPGCAGVKAIIECDFALATAIATQSTPTRGLHLVAHCCRASGPLNSSAADIACIFLLSAFAVSSAVVSDGCTPHLCMEAVGALWRLVPVRHTHERAVLRMATGGA